MSKKLRDGDYYFLATRSATLFGKPHIEIREEAKFATFEEARLYAKGALELMDYPKLSNFDKEEQQSKYRISPVCEAGKRKWGYTKETCGYYARYDYIIHQGQYLYDFSRGDKVGTVKMKVCQNGECNELEMPTVEQLATYQALKLLWPNVNFGIGKPTDIEGEMIRATEKALRDIAECSNKVSLLKSAYETFLRNIGSPANAAKDLIKLLVKYAVEQQLNPSEAVLPFIELLNKIATKKEAACVNIVLAKFRSNFQIEAAEN